MCWQRLASVKSKQRKATKLAMKNLKIPKLPLVVTITRLGPRKLDDDNLQSACKYIRDEIARAVGVDDGSPQYTWLYGQRTGNYGVEIEMVTRGDGL